MQHPELMEKSHLQEGTGKARGGERLRWSHTSKSKLLRMTLLAFCCGWVSSQYLQQQRALGWPEATSHTPQRDPDGLALPDVAPIPSQRGSHPFPTWLPSLPHLTELPGLLGQLCLLQGAVSSLQIACPSPALERRMFM